MRGAKFVKPSLKEAVAQVHGRAILLQQLVLRRWRDLRPSGGLHPTHGRDGHRAVG